MGGGTFGVQAARGILFRQDRRATSSLAQGGDARRPVQGADEIFAPHINLPAARARANDVLSNMVDAGFMTEGQVYAARRNPATPVDRSATRQPDWYLDFAYDEVRRSPNADKLGDDRVLTVRTGLDANMQRKAESVDRGHAAASAARLSRHTGRGRRRRADGVVRAIVGGRDYGASQFNRATDALRQPGSSFKPFVYLTALMTGKIHADTIVDGSGVCIGDWCPHNFGGVQTRLAAAARRARAIAEHGGGPAVDHDRRSLLAAEASPTIWPTSPSSAAPRSSTRRARWASPRRCPTRSRCRSAPTTSR